MHEPESIDLQVLAQDTVTLLQGLASTKQLQFEQSIPSGLFIHADRNMVETILRNLASNALKFTTEGGRVSISARWPTVTADG